jgi:hypothetical protein
MPRDDPSSRRKTKRDKKAKAKYKQYKRGGQHRSTKIKITKE